MYLRQLTVSLVLIASCVIWDAQALPARTQSASSRGPSQMSTGRKPSHLVAKHPPESEVSEEDSEQEDKDYDDDDSSPVAPPPTRSKQQSRVPLKQSPNRNNNSPQPQVPQNKQRTQLRKPAGQYVPSQKSPVTQALKPSRKPPAPEVDSDYTLKGNPSPTSFGNRRLTSSQQSPAPNRRHPSSSLGTQMSSQQQAVQNLSKKTSNSKRKTQSRNKTPSAETSMSEESNSPQSSKKSESKTTQNGQQSQPMEIRHSIAKAETVDIAKETPQSRELALGSKSSVETSEYTAGLRPGPAVPGPVAVRPPVNAEDLERKNPEPGAGRPVNAVQPERSNPEPPAEGAGSVPANESPASPETTS